MKRVCGDCVHCRAATETELAYCTKREKDIVLASVHNACDDWEAGTKRCANCKHLVPKGRGEVCLLETRAAWQNPSDLACPKWELADKAPTLFVRYTHDEIVDVLGLPPGGQLMWIKFDRDKGVLINYDHPNPVPTSDMGARAWGYQIT